MYSKSNKPHGFTSHMLKRGQGMNDQLGADSGLYVLELRGRCCHMSFGFLLTASFFSLLGYGLCYISMASKKERGDKVQVSFDKVP